MNRGVRNLKDSFDDFRNNTTTNFDKAADSADTWGDKVKSNFDKGKGAVDGATDSIKELQEAFEETPYGGQLAKSIYQMGGATGDGVGDILANVTKTSLGGASGGKAAKMGAAAMAAVPGYQSASGYRPQSITSSGNLSLHSDASNPAQDISGENMVAIGQFLASHYGQNLRELIHTPLGFGIKNGQRVPLSYWGSVVNADHYDHVHVADRGAIVKGPALIAQGNITEAHIPLTGPGARGGLGTTIDFHPVIHVHGDAGNLRKTILDVYEDVRHSEDRHGRARI